MKSISVWKKKTDISQAWIRSQRVFKGGKPGPLALDRHLDVGETKKGSRPPPRYIIILRKPALRPRAGEQKNQKKKKTSRAPAEPATKKRKEKRGNPARQIQRKGVVFMGSTEMGAKRVINH